MTSPPTDREIKLICWFQMKIAGRYKEAYCDPVCTDDLDKVWRLFCEFNELATQLARR